MEDHKRMERILRLFKSLAALTLKGHAVGQSFARLCTTFENCGNVENMQLVAQSLLKSILLETYRLSESELRTLKRDLGCIVGRIGAGQGPVSLLLFQRFSDKGDPSGSADGEDVLFRSPSSPMLAAKIFSIGAFERKNGACAKELAVTYKFGFQNNRPQPVRALQLYSKAIDESGNVSAMNDLAGLLYKGAERVPVNHVRAAERYSKAIEQGRDVRAMNYLAFLLYKGAAGVPANPSKAAELFQRAIDESSDVFVINFALNNLAYVLLNGAEVLKRTPSKLWNSSCAS